MTCRECLNNDTCAAGGNTKFSEEKNVEERCRLFKSARVYKNVVLCDACRFCSKNSGYPDVPPWCNHPHSWLSYADIPNGWGCPLGERVGT